MTWSVSSEPAPVRRAPAKKPSVCPEESQEQKALFKWWRVYSRHAPHLVMYHIPNGGRRDKITGARLKAEGVVAGDGSGYAEGTDRRTPSGGVPRRGLQGLVGGAGSRRKLSDRGIAPSKRRQGMRERVADVIVPITGGRLDMLAKATATLHRAVEVQAYVWGVGRNRIAIFGPLRRTVGGVGMLVYRLKRLKVEKGINLDDRKAEGKDVWDCPAPVVDM